MKKIKDIKTLSQSSLSMWHRCPLQWMFRYVENLPTEVPKNHAAILGTALHEVIDEMYKKENFNFKFLSNNWKEVFTKVCDKENIKFDNVKQEQYRIREGHKILGVYFNSASKRGFLIPPISTEASFKVPLKSFSLIGRIDLVIKPKDEILIIDYKSSKREITQKQLDNDKQLTFYSWAARKELGIREEKVGLFYLRTGNIIWSKRERNDYLSLAMEAIQAMKKIRAGKFYPSFRCRFCEYPESCRRWINKNRITVDILWD